MIEVWASNLENKKIIFLIRWKNAKNWTYESFCCNYYEQSSSVQSEVDRILMLNGETKWSWELSYSSPLLIMRWPLIFRG